MQIETKYLGQVDIIEENIKYFEMGILGFEDEHEFVLLEIPNNDHFCFLQSIHTSYIAFLVVNPWDFFEDYDVEIPDEELKKLGILPDQQNQMAIYSIVTLGDTLKESTANLLAPVLINLEDKKGKQFILNDSLYATKHKLFPQEIGE
ncbi:flagellar assembly factor FliW [Alkalibaculum bacchi]|uniref:Flagellar assembly factor FliW n=1 Tax=Alkalibaculum bacchi TaxID=645887 RepID=A0A366IFJ3_9FIRM|nr:flagellar assembly protein FliW [Alkalibaculum bacchi]RBP70123.1 flagellar assembly factor FliW [Alkalibaculum bacchi]